MHVPRALVRTAVLVLTLGFVLGGPVQVTATHAPQQSTVTKTFQLTVNGSVPAGEFLYVEYEPRSSDPDDIGFAHFCGALFQIQEKPPCQGNGTVYTETRTFPAGTAITFSFERSNQNTSTGVGDPYEIEVIQTGTETLNSNSTTRVTYTYRTAQLYLPVIITQPTPTLPIGSVTGNAVIDEVMYNPAGDDVLGEYVLIRNSDPGTIDMTGWQLYDVGPNYTYTFPPFTLAPGAAVRVWTGIGMDDGANLYWDRQQAVWNNEGDVATLVRADQSFVDEYRYEP